MSRGHDAGRQSTHRHRWCDRTQPPMIMGILNVTPDSFSDGGSYTDTASAVERAVDMVGQGADIIDIGGESTRPGAARKPAAVQIARVVPVVRELRSRISRRVMISIDTSLAEVAAAALEVGADMINDISAGRDSSDMLALAAARGAPIVLMHMQGEPATMQQDPSYTDVVDEVTEFLQQRFAAAVAAGIDEDHVLLDPGIGFGKRREDNLALLAGLEQLAAMGRPLLLGTSRKRFMGSLCAETEPTWLVGATCATTALGVAAGVRVFRVHDIAANRQAADVAWAVCGQTPI